MSAQQKSCGFIGLGAMGAPMARHLHRQGALGVVGNLSAGKARELAAELGVLAAAGADDFSACQVVVLCVSADADVLANVDALGAVLAPGSLVIDHSTVAPDTAREAARRLAARRIDFLDAPVSGGVEGARNGRLSVMAGGDASVLERARSTLEAYSARIALMGGHGSGQAAKAVNQVLVAGINEAVCEGLALSEKLGLDPAALLPTLAAGAAGNWFLDKRGESMLADRFTPGFKCAHMLKDLQIVHATARAVGASTAVVEQAIADYSRLVDAGRGDEDTSALITLKRG